MKSGLTVLKALVKYELLVDVLSTIPKDIKMVLGDWNAQVGQESSRWEHIMGRYLPVWLLRKR